MQIGTATTPTAPRNPVDPTEEPATLHLPGDGRPTAGPSHAPPRPPRSGVPRERATAGAKRLTEEVPR